MALGDRLGCPESSGSLCAGKQCSKARPEELAARGHAQPSSGAGGYGEHRDPVPQSSLASSGTLSELTPWVGMEGQGQADRWEDTGSVSRC